MKEKPSSEPIPYDAFNGNEKKDGCACTIRAQTNGRSNNGTLVIEPTDEPQILDPQNQRKADIPGTIQAKYANGLKHGPIVVEPIAKEVANVIDSDKRDYQRGRVYDPESAAPSLDTMSGGNRQPKVTEFTETQTSMFTPEGDVKRYAGDPRVDEFKEGQCADISFPNGYNKGPRVHNEAPALNTTTTTETSFVVKQSDPAKKTLRIRKLIPKECFRLMGVKDEDFAKIEPHFANSTLFHLAGDSIVTPCLMGIFKALGANDEADALLKVSDIIKEAKSDESKKP